MYTHFLQTSKLAEILFKSYSAWSCFQLHTIVILPAGQKIKGPCDSKSVYACYTLAFIDTFQLHTTFHYRDTFVQIQAICAN